METDKTTHLGSTEEEINLTEFEVQLWRAFNAFATWQEECEKITNQEELTADDIGVLHIVRFKERPKTVVELGRILNRNNFFSINYNINKLLKLGLVKRVDPPTGKQHHYAVTEKGIINTDRYNLTRRSLLTKGLARELKNINIEETIRGITKLRELYEEATKNTTLYQPPSYPVIDSEKKPPKNKKS